MSNDRWQRTEDIFHRAVGMAPEARAAFLSDACGADDSLRQEVESLLAHDAEDGSTFAGAAVLQVSGTGQSLMTGRTISHYEIIERLGQGGMGVVYKARDSHLKRFVALKVLPPEKVADSGRRRRFVQEARSASALNHPNIVTVYDIDQSDGIDFIAMEYVEGQTLDDLIRGKRLKLNETLKYGVQIADALAKAHAAGIVHRDLKPGNVMVTSEGRAKVLDFGLAKLTETAPASSEGPTLSERSSIGLIVGTVGYMSPEQARGKTADARSDIFSLGVVIYEMLSGQRAFHRGSAIETLNAILKEDPPPLEDAALERIVRRCLEKSPEQRFQSASDLGFAIAGLTGSSTVTAHPAAAVPSRRFLAWPVLVVLALAVGAAGGWWWQLRRETSAQGWTGVQLGGPSMAIAPRLSPDGRTLAFVGIVDGQTQVAVMNPVSGNWTALTHERSAGSMLTISWSRDGTKIYFDRLIGSTGSIHSVPALGGDDRLVLEDAERPEVLPDGSLIVIRVNPEGQHQVHRFWPSTGNIQALPFLSAGESLGGMRAFADGQEVALLGRPLVGSQEETSPGAYALDLKSLRTRRLFPFTGIQGWQPLVPSADGRSVLTSVRTGDLYRVVMGARDGSGSPRTALTLTNPLSGLDVAADGSLYTTQTETSLEVLRFPVGGGVAEKLVEASAPFQPRYLLQLPDGRFLFQGFPAGRSRLLVAGRGKDPVPLVETEEITAQPMALMGDQHVALLAGSDSDNLGVAVADLSTGRIVRRLARTNRLQIQSLASSPDGKTLYYGAGGGIWSIPAEDGEARKLTRGNAIAVDPHGQELVVQRFEKDGAHLFRLALQGGAEERIPFPGPLFLHGWSIASNSIHGDGRIVVLAFSPDSYWNQIVILDPKTGKAERVPVQHSGDIFAPGWTRDGRILAAGNPLKSTLWRFSPK